MVYFSNSARCVKQVSEIRGNSNMIMVTFYSSYSPDRIKIGPLSLFFISSVTGGRIAQIVPCAIITLPLTHTLLLNVSLNLIVFTAGKLTRYVLDNARSIVFSKTFLN